MFDPLIFEKIIHGVLSFIAEYKNYFADLIMFLLFAFHYIMAKNKTGLYIAIAAFVVAEIAVAKFGDGTGGIFGQVDSGIWKEIEANTGRTFFASLKEYFWTLAGISVYGILFEGEDGENGVSTMTMFMFFTLFSITLFCLAVPVWAFIPYYIMSKFMTPFYFGRGRIQRHSIG